MEVLPSHEDLEVRSCIVKTKNTQGVYPTSRLRYLEGYAGEPIPLTDKEVPSNQSDVLERKKLPRDAKTKASKRLKELNLHLVGMFLSTTGKENWVLHPVEIMIVRNSSQVYRKQHYQVRIRTAMTLYHGSS